MTKYTTTRRLGALLGAVATTIAMGAALLAPPLATAASQPAGRLVQTEPVSGTPHVLDGRVYISVKVGNYLVLGGSFSRARNDSSTTEITRNRLLAVDLRTNQIVPGFNPSPDDTVRALLPGADGQSVYVGGDFDAIAGTSRGRLVKLRIPDGSVDAGFDAGKITGGVRDLRLSGGKLWVAGAFTHVQGNAQTALATVDPATGRFDPYMGLTVAGIHNGGSTTVTKIDITPDGSTLVAIGNFDTLQGVKRHQAFQLDLRGTSAAPRNWQTSYFETRCSSSFYSYMRDVDISPDGRYFVVVTTGAYGGPDVACDSSSRWEIASTGSGIRPSWQNQTGGDTLWSVEIDDSAVYVGGHPRWQNNPFRGDTPGPGAVSRPGIAALDPVNGLPFSWNPTRTRGVGVFDFIRGPEGLWVASDTDRIGSYQYRGRIALLPGDGVSYQAIRTPGLPNDLYSASGGGLTKRAATASSFSAPAAASTGPVDWSGVKGSFMLNGTLYLAKSDGSFVRRTFDGSSFGGEVPVNTHDLLAPLTAWQDDIRSMTSLFYDSGRIYFTRAGSNTLYYRYFTPESDVVGAQRQVASAGVAGVDLSQTTGAFLADDRLYFTKGSDLLRAGWQAGPISGAPVAGSAVPVSGPLVDGQNWSTTRAPFLFQDANGNDSGGTTATPPQAAFASSCQALTCALDASQSTGGSSAISEYRWSFGDQSSGTGRTVEHTYASAGSYQVSLTVTNQSGATSTTTRTVEVTEPSGTSDADVVPVAAVSSNGNRSRHEVTTPSSVRAGDRLVLFTTMNSDTVSVTGPAGWTAIPGAARTERGFQAQGWTRVATAADAGSRVTVTSSGYAKSDLSLAAYRSTTGAPVSIGAFAASSAAGTRTSYPTPQVTLPSGATSWVMSYWGSKASGSQTWSAPASEVERTKSVGGSGGGSVSALLADSGEKAGGSTGGGVVGTVNDSVGRVVAYTVALSVS